MSNKACQLYNRVCKNCGECLMCDLNPNKKCTNCEKCLSQVDDFRSLNLEEFMIVQEENEVYKNRRGK